MKKMTREQHRLRHAGMRRYTVLVALGVRARNPKVAESMARGVAAVGVEGSPYAKQIAVDRCFVVSELG